MVDTGVYVAARALLESLVMQLEDTRASVPPVFGVRPGNSVPMEACGSAWTRVVSITPTTNFPTQQPRAIPASQALQLAAVIELGVDRCHPLDPKGRPLPDAVLDSLARDVADDAAAMLRAVRCLDMDTDVMVGPWVPRGPLGGIHGGTMTVTVLVDTCGCESQMPPLDEVVPMLPGDPRAPVTP